MSALREWPYRPWPDHVCNDDCDPTSHVDLCYTTEPETQEFMTTDIAAWPRMDYPGLGKVYAVAVWPAKDAPPCPLGPEYAHAWRVRLRAIAP